MEARQCRQSTIVLFVFPNHPGSHRRSRYSRIQPQKAHHNLSLQWRKKSVLLNQTRLDRTITKKMTEISRDMTKGAGTAASMYFETGIGEKAMMRGGACYYPVEVASTNPLFGRLQ
jgi:hypothetical protein